MLVMGVVMGCAGRPCSDHRAREGRRRVQFPWSAVITGRWGGRTESSGRTWGARRRIVSTRAIVS